MSVVTPSGFLAAGVAAGIKPDGALDLALIAAREPASVAAVFTTSRTAAPPVEVSRRRVAGGRIRAVVVNSGSANAGTGAQGVSDAEAMAAAAGTALACPQQEVLVCSTGPIGGRLPLERISSAVPDLVGSLGDTPRHGELAARAIMTTDTVPKSAAHRGEGFSTGGIAKGAGMLRPDMATMLAFLTTDAVADASALGPVLRAAVDSTFNCLNVDGCQSTNDTVVLLASGSSGHRPALAELAAGVNEVCSSLALAMARDAEGASKVVTLQVAGAGSDGEARRLGMAVADSALVRSSFYGADPNWGRILAALGVAGVHLDPSSIEIAYEGVVTCRGGVGVPFEEDALARRLTGDFTVSVAVGEGPGSATIVTTDLTPDYVRFNGERS